MNKKIKDLFNTIKYKRKANKMENNYKSVLEEINPLKDEIIRLQKDKIVLLERCNELNDKLIEKKGDDQNE